MAASQAAIAAKKPASATDQESIAALAYSLWQERGSPEGSPEEDWYRAEEELKAGLAQVDG